MDPKFATSGVLPLKLLCKPVLLTKRAKAEDFRFIKMSLLEDSCLDFHGFKTGAGAGQAPKPKTKVSFRELLDQTPSEPSTMLTAMVDYKCHWSKDNCVHCRSAALQCDT